LDEVVDISRFSKKNRKLPRTERTCPPSLVVELNPHSLERSRFGAHHPDCFVERGYNRKP